MELVDATDPMAGAAQWPRLQWQWPWPSARSRSPRSSACGASESDRSRGSGSTAAKVAVAVAVGAISLSQVLCMWSLWVRPIPWLGQHSGRGSSGSGLQRDLARPDPVPLVLPSSSTRSCFFICSVRAHLEGSATAAVSVLSVDSHCHWPARPFPPPPSGRPRVRVGSCDARLDKAACTKARTASTTTAGLWSCARCPELAGSVGGASEAGGPKSRGVVAVRCDRRPARARGGCDWMHRTLPLH